MVTETGLVAGVDLDYALVPGGGRAVDELASALELLFEDWPEAGVGEERVAGEAGVWVRALERLAERWLEGRRPPRGALEA
jgi:hypothetical protein